MQMNLMNEQMKSNTHCQLRGNTSSICLSQEMGATEGGVLCEEEK